MLALWYRVFGDTLESQRTFGLLQHLGIVFALSFCPVSAGLFFAARDPAEELTAVKARWEEEKRAIDRIRALQAEQEQVQLAMEQAERQGDLARASELKYGETVRLEADLVRAREALTVVQGDQPLLKEEVTEDDVAAAAGDAAAAPTEEVN